MSVVDRVRDLVQPLLTERDMDLYDVELAGRELRVVVEPVRAGGSLDLDALSDVTRALSRALDEADPISSAYTLEVTSPGLERNLRTPAHFERAVGTVVNVRTHPDVEGERRVRGELTAADSDGVTVKQDDGVERRLQYDEIERARTVFEWGPTPRPAKPGSQKKAVRQ